MLTSCSHLSPPVTVVAVHGWYIFALSTNPTPQVASSRAAHISHGRPDSGVATPDSAAGCNTTDETCSAQNGAPERRSSAQPSMRQNESSLCPVTISLAAWARLFDRLGRIL